jgi:3beta-hydroxysteroid-4beta-carboxylate 3-dehydrogenase (decarboxylating)
MKILVTGASGHLGANLVRRLLWEGEDVRVLVRPGPDNRGVEVLGKQLEVIEGDLRDVASLERATRGVQRAYHCAAQVVTVAGREQEIFDCNVLGTRNLLRAARESGVERVVVTGSFSACGHLPGQVSDETVPFNPFAVAMPYEKSKAAVEHEVLKAVVDGQDVVIATSCAILGPYDYKPSRMGRLLRDFANGKVLAYIPGGFEFVAARDIVEGHRLAMDKGRAGQKYIISSGHVTVDELVAIMSRVTGRRKPPLRLPPPLMAVVAEITTRVLKVFAPGSPQRLTPGAVQILRQHRRADVSKAKRELGFAPTPIEDAIREQYEWFVSEGHVRGKTGEFVPRWKTNGYSEREPARIDFAQR